MYQSRRVPTVAEAVLPQTTLWRHATLVVGFSLLNAIAAQVSIPLAPVPITAQTFVVLMTGMLLGSRLGAVTMLAYLAEGAGGLPVFSSGRAGAAHLIGPTGGYLFGFVLAAYIVGWLAERGWDRRVWTTALAMVIGNLVIYAAGVGWLATLIGPAAAVAGGLVPFIPGDVLKIALATVLLPTGWKLVDRGTGGTM